MITDLLISSPIINDFDGAAPADMGGNEDAGANFGAGGQFADYGGVDPSLDPELAEAMKISLEEERAKQKAEGDGSEAAPVDSSSAPAPAPVSPRSTGSTYCLT